MDKAVNFYKKVVGWDVRDAGMSDFTYMIFGKDGKDVGGMMTWAGAGAPDLLTQWMGHIHTAKLDAELKSVIADGGTIVRPAQDIPALAGSRWYWTRKKLSTSCSNRANKRRRLVWIRWRLVMLVGTNCSPMIP